MERTLSEKESRFVIDDIKESSEEERSIVHWVSTESVDRTGDVVRSKGMDDEDYKKNPVVLYGHNYAGFPVGKSVWRRRTERNGIKGVLAKTQFAPTPEGQQVFELWKGGYLNAASIGFKPIDYEPIMDGDGKWTGGYDIKSWSLWEYSIVPVPANQDAVRLAIEKGLLRESKVAEPLFRHYLEARVCELESCRDKMAPIQDVVGEMKARLDAIPNYGVVMEKIMERLEKLERPAETIGRKLTSEDISVLGSKLAAGVVSQLRGKL